MGNKNIMPLIPDKFMFDFLRGVFDGDGWFVVNNDERKDRNKQRLYLRIGLAGLENFLLEIQSYLKKLGINCAVRNMSDANKKCKELKLVYHNAHKFAKLIYKRKNAFCLQRKKEKYLTVINNRKTWINDKY